MRGYLLMSTVVLAAAPVYAQSDQVRRGSVPDWVEPSPLLPVPENGGGLVFLRHQDLAVHLDAQGQSQYLGYRVKILQSAALQLGNLAVAWNPAAGSATVHVVRIHRGADIIDVLPKASFEVLRREDQLEAAKLDGLLTAVMRIPDLRVGDELEVGFTVVSKDSTLGGREAGLLVLPPNPAPGRYHLALSWAPADRPTISLSKDLTSAAVKTDRRIDFQFDDPVALNPPKDAPPRYQWQRAMEYSDFADWPSVSRHFAPLYVTAAKLAGDSPIKREAARIAAAHPSVFDRANAALQLVQQDVRYIYVGLNGGNLTPASADVTWQRRYGDCKGKTALLLALLSEFGIEAEPVLVNSTGADDGFDQRLPMPHLFDHVLVRAVIDGKPYWLDGTLPAALPPGPTPIFPVRWVLPLTTEGSKLVDLGWKPAKTPDEVNLYEIDARAGFDKPARITTTGIVRGIKGLQQQLQFSSMPSSQMLKAFRQELIGDTWQTIDDVKWRYDVKSAASILTITGTGAIDWDDGGGAKSLALPGGGFSPPEKRLRSPDQDQDAPYYTQPEYSCRVTTVRLPSTTLPRQWSSKPGYDTRLFGRNYYRAFEMRDGAIRMVRASRVDQPEIDAAAAKRDNARIASFDNSMGYIFYNPPGQKPAVGDASSVPATYDFDWTASDVPCLSRKSLMTG